MTYSIWTFDAAGITWTLGMTALLTCLVLLARKPIAQAFGAHWAYALWAIPFARLILPPINVPTGWIASFGALSSRTAETAPPALPDASTAAFRAYAPPAAPMPPAPPVEIALHNPLNWMGLLIAVWAIGALACIGWVAYRHWQFMRIVDRETSPADEALTTMANRTAEEINYKGRAKIATSLISSSPMVTGLLRPTVLLPAWFTADYTPNEQRAAIAHELSHVSRADLWALQAAHLFVAVQWFNPLAHVALRAFRSDQEAACDATVLRVSNLTPHAYGTALLKAARGSIPLRSSALAAGLPLTHALKERLTLMQSTPPTRTRKIAAGGLAALLGIAACATAAVADPAPDRKHTNITISESGTITVDGEIYKDRTFIMIGDPFEGVEPDFEKIKVFESFAELEALRDLKGLESLAELETLKVLEDVGVWTSIDDVNVEHFEGEDGQKIIIHRNGEMSDEDIEKIRAKAQEAARRGAQMAARGEAHAKAVEKRMAIHTLRMEELDGEFEEMFGEDFEANIEASSTVISTLVDECVAAKLNDNSPNILSSTHSVNGKTFKGLCLKKDTMSDAALTTFLANNTDLDNAQITKVIRERSGSHKSSWTFSDSEDLVGGDE